MGVRSRSKRRRGASAGGADWISDLCDDVLMRILELLPHAGDAVRTGALSRCWRGLWTRASSLTFDSSRRRRLKSAASSDKRFLDFVHNALAQRAKTDATLDLERLAISFAIMSPAGLRANEAMKPLVLRSAHAAHEWIWYSMQKTVKSFVLKLRLLATWNCYRREMCTGNFMKQYQLEHPMMDLNNLPSSAKLETMHLELEGVRLRLPAAAVFASLMDLSLENFELVSGSGHLLARLLSSACCPSLQKLQLRKLTLPKLNELLIEASALLKLSMSSGQPISNYVTLKLKTPSLRSLHIEDYMCLKTLGISAPRLEELTFLPHQPDYINVDGELPCVESLKVVDLHTHRNEDFFEYDVNNSSICLLSTSLTCLEVSLKVKMGEGFVDSINGRIPHLPHLISLTVHVYLRKLHLFGVGLAEILKQCSHLKYLRVHCIHEIYPSFLPQAGRNSDSFCDHPDHWKSLHMYLANIQEVEFTGLAGTECESWFMKRVLAHARHLQKVALSFDARFMLCNMIDDFIFVPCSGGTWICHYPCLSYEWNPGPMHK